MAKQKNHIINDYGQLVLIKEGGIAPWTKVVADVKIPPAGMLLSRAGILRGNERTPHAFGKCNNDPDWKWRT